MDNGLAVYPAKGCTGAPGHAVPAATSVESTLHPVSGRSFPAVQSTQAQPAQCLLPDQPAYVVGSSVLPAGLHHDCPHRRAYRFGPPDRTAAPIAMHILPVQARPAKTIAEVSIPQSRLTPVRGAVHMLIVNRPPAHALSVFQAKQPLKASRSCGNWLRMSRSAA